MVGTAGWGWLKCFAIEAVFINFFKMLKQALRMPAGALPSVMWNSEGANRQPCNINWLPPSCDMNLSPPVKNEPVWDKSTNYACNETMSLFKPYIRLCSQIINSHIFMILISTYLKSIAKVTCRYIYICPSVDSILD